MVKKKIPFIDKKNSTTWTLTYGGQHDEGEHDAVSVSQSAADRYDFDDGLSAYGSESQYG
jgi:predicted neuraminidase